MKKFLDLALSFALTLPLAACGGNPGNASAPPSGSSNTQDSIQIMLDNSNMTLEEQDKWLYEQYQKALFK